MLTHWYDQHGTTSSCALCLIWKQGWHQSNRIEAIYGPLILLFTSVHRLYCVLRWPKKDQIGKLPSIQIPNWKKTWFRFVCPSSNLPSCSWFLTLNSSVSQLHLVISCWFPTWVSTRPFPEPASKHQSRHHVTTRRPQIVGVSSFFVGLR